MHAVKQQKNQIFRFDKAIDLESVNEEPIVLSEEENQVKLSMPNNSTKVHGKRYSQIWFNFYI